MKKLLVVLSLVMVLAFAGSSFAATGHGGNTGTPATTISTPAGAATAAKSVSQADINALAADAGLPSNTTLATAAEVQSALTSISTETATAQYSAASDAVKADSDSSGGEAAVLATFDASTFSSATNDNPVAAPIKTEDSVNQKLAAANPNDLLFKFYYRGLLNNAPSGSMSFKNGFVIVIFPAVLAGLSNSSVEAAAEADAFTPVVTVKAASSGGQSGESTDTDNVVGGSGGGCVAGTSALALAVLGMFIAKGKK